MADSKAPRSLDDMLKADRKKRKAEALASEIFGKNRRQSAPNSGKNTPAPGGSLASRMGITKRSSSSSSLSRQKPPARLNPPSALSRTSTAARLETAVAANGSSTPSFKSQKPHANGKVGRSTNGEISIRGAAGPYTVVAQNFAPGTTAADIESVMQPVGGDMMSCRLAASNPTVIAEMVFMDRQGADNVIATFNNKKADGRLLYVYMKEGGATAAKVPDPEPSPAPVPEPVVQDLTMEVDEEPNESAYREERAREDFARARRDERPYDRERERERYGRDDRRRAEPAYQDGRYGFGETPQGPRWDGGGGRDGGGRREQWRGGDSRMYSDNMMRRPGPRGGRW